MKKLMLLGGIRYLLPVIQAAHAQGYYVITADYLPHNIAHQYSDEYVNVSIIDKEAVLKAAQEKHIDGIMSFGVDPGVISAAYVQEQMHLPMFGPYESVCVLQHKDKFRAYLQKHHFNVPWAKGYASIDEAWKERENLPYPVIVKPTDSAGSKGVSRVDGKDTLLHALQTAYNKSVSHRIIIEQFIEKQGCSSDTDCMSVNGKMVFVNFNAQHFDASAANPYTPASFSWPSTYTREQIDTLTHEIQRLITLLGMKTAVYNVETRIGSDGTPYIMELSPRGGGNRLCEMLRYAYDADMITAITRYAVGDSISDIKSSPLNGYWAEIILHAGDCGTYESVAIDDAYRKYIVEEDIWVNKGETISAFNGANDAIGTLVMHFENENSMNEALACQHKWLKIVVK